MQVKDLIAQKKSLRTQYLALRTSIPMTEKTTLDAALCREIAAHPTFLACDLLLCFFPVRGEPDLRDLYQLARERGIKTAFPRCVGTQMTFHTVESENELQEGRFGIRAPYADAPLATCSARTLCLVPALAAARDGTRLGYGGGFYDRFLPRFPGIALLPIYSALICDALPREQTDRTVHHILSEKGEITQNV